MNGEDIINRGVFFLNPLVIYSPKSLLVKGDKKIFNPNLSGEDLNLLKQLSIILRNGNFSRRWTSVSLEGFVKALIRLKGEPEDAFLHRFYSNALFNWHEWGQLPFQDRRLAKTLTNSFSNPEDRAILRYLIKSLTESFKIEKDLKKFL